MVLIIGMVPACSHLVGLYVQLISATREERIIIVTGVVAAFVGPGWASARRLLRL